MFSTKLVSKCPDSRLDGNLRPKGQMSRYLFSLNNTSISDLVSEIKKKKIPRFGKFK